MSEQFVRSVQVIVRRDGEGVHDHVRSQVDVLSLVILHDLFDGVDLGFNGIHVLIEYSPVEYFFLRGVRETFLSIPIKSELLVHLNIALLIVAHRSDQSLLHGGRVQILNIYAFVGIKLSIFIFKVFRELIDAAMALW